MNRQIGVGDSKYVIFFDPLLTGHVIRRMRSGRVRIFMAADDALLTYLTSATQRVTSQTSAESYKKDVVLESF